MARTLFRLSILALLSLFVVVAQADARGAVSVHGYFRKDGTYVQPYMRSAPDGNPYNNYSFPGNVNPYTGKTAPGNPDTYLRNYYDRKGGAGAPAVTAIPLPAPDSATVGGTSNSPALLEPGEGLTTSAPLSGLPEHATLDVFGTGWQCQRGYHQQGNACVAVAMPEHAMLDVFGSGWQCQRGYHQQGNACVPVEMPEHATLDVFGSGWQCQRGYRIEADACVVVGVSLR